MLGDAFAPKDAALRAVGRTVVNFQILEHHLKFLARFRPSEGTLAKVRREVEKRADKASLLTLGQAIHAWLDAIEDDRPQANTTNDLFEPTLRVAFSFGADSEARRAHGETLKALLETRNNLVHGGLVPFNWTSQASCELLVLELDHVNEAIMSEIDFFVGIRNGLQSIQDEDVEIIEAPDVPN